MNFVPLSVAFALRHMIQCVEPSRGFDGKLWCRTDKNGMKQAEEEMEELPWNKSIKIGQDV